MSRMQDTSLRMRHMVQDVWLQMCRASPLLWLAVALWLAVLALGALVLPAQFVARAHEREALRQAQSAQAQGAQAALQNGAAEGELPLTQRESSQRNVAQFKVLLAQAPLPEGAQQTLFVLAKRWELELPQGQYKQACDESGTWCSYRMQLPVVGSYTAVRGFVQDALHRLPSLALDGAAFKRDAAGVDDLEVALRWTLYQPPMTGAGNTP